MTVEEEGKEVLQEAPQEILCPKVLMVALSCLRLFDSRTVKG